MHRAFTLVETVITIALFVILVLAVAQLYLVYGRSILSEQSSIDVMLGGGGIIDAVQTAGLQADHIVASHMFAGTNYSSGPTTILFELPAVDSSGSIITNTYDYIGVYASSTEAYRVIDAAPGSMRASGKKRLTDALNALLFTYNNASFPAVTSATVDATTTALSHGQQAQTHIRKNIYLRNL